jgi:hypothetical protein
LEAAWKKMESIRYPVESFPQQAATTSPWISFCTDKKRNTASLFNLKVLVTVGVRPGSGVPGFQ